MHHHHMTMLLLAAGLAATCAQQQEAAQPSAQPSTSPIPIIKYENEGVNPDGSYKWSIGEIRDSLEIRTNWVYDVHKNE
ncbi:hypothetical protein FOCC_FOCC009346 [Frankliniella occidentalis]|nr:hypothetical protein FOCC_FOCC009346 [Frankliniella occidentalis]